ncbi:GSU2403 family nucleotidyltransferase fold protein [Methylobacterium sp. UNC300MFChir4.1]|uniref:GSU2403 family nucleotidyltransferase fold protein n=1 Tax=Methylobacterium sp. UNC300MFChir4.1 TaxID=1502747 RepID=UPI0011137D66|nr:GSU2403 family nucleotidyltransferase fold protein [Methylobacterium sp. UNC300MFChir4.1]
MIFAYIVFMMIRPLSLAQHTLYADLLDQGGDDLFDPDFPENGSLLIRGNRAGAPADHVYYQGYRRAAGDAGRGQRFSRYLGRSDDPEVAARIARFRRVKAVREERTTTVRALIGAGMPRPSIITGRIIEAVARAGLFRDQAVLLGDIAFQAYGGILGVRFAKARCTPESDRPNITLAVRNSDRLGQLIDALQTIDPSFAAEPSSATTYRSASGLEITASADNACGTPSNLVNFVMERAIAALVLHGPGIPVLVPAPERYLAYTQLRQNDGPPAGEAELAAALKYVGREHAVTQALADAGAMLSRLTSP